jgi:VTC domain
MASVRRPLLPAGERLEPIGLEALDAAAALRRRFDTKYLLPRHALDALVTRLEPTHRVLEIHGLRDFEYRTTYFDTGDLAAFRDHLKGRRRRLKVRVRRYVESRGCFFEVKLRGPREATVKRRVRHDPASPRCLDAASLSALDRWVREAYGRRAPAGLAPALEVAYRRVSLVAPARGERLTVDLGVRMWAPGGHGGRLDPELCVVESKSPRGFGLAARELTALRARPLQMMSKYCVGVLLAHGPSRGNALLPVLRHCEGGLVAHDERALRPAA